MKKLVLAILFVGFFVAPTATAWATISFVKPQDATYQVELTKKSTIPHQISQESKTWAPEPTTMILFGSGFIGMVMGFVRRTYSFFKRCFDLVFAGIGIIIAMPFLVLTAILVKVTSEGPIIYSQIRVGRNRKIFRIYKFRTMKADAEKATGPVWAAANDNRLTPIGNFLRKSHIDELPQLFNVLKGEMSIIGPRPERPVFVSQFKEIVPDYEKRLAVKPGITGLAQVWHRYDETIQDVKKKVKYDLLYIKRMNIWADFGIILRTCRVVLTGEGAR